MSFIDFLGDAAKGAGACVLFVTALPIAGAVGTITAVGAGVAATVGAIGGAVDYVNKNS